MILLHFCTFQDWTTFTNPKFTKHPSLQFFPWQCVQRGPLRCRVVICLKRTVPLEMGYVLFIGPESDHWLCLSVTHSLTDSLTHCCLVNLMPVNIAVLTRVRSLAMLVTHSLPNSLTPVSKLDLLDACEWWCCVLAVYNKLLPTWSSASTSATVTTSTSFELASSHAKVTSINFTKQESVSELVS